MEVEGGADMEGSMMEGDGNTMTSLEGINCLLRFLFDLLNNDFSSFLTIKMMLKIPFKLLLACAGPLEWLKLRTPVKMWPIVSVLMMTTRKTKMKIN